jgi:hypothetical protein
MLKNKGDPDFLQDDDRMLAAKRAALLQLRDGRADQAAI